MAEATSRVVSSMLSYAADENTERGNWSGKMDFFLSLLGYAVGLGNVWRFPYLVYRNGGGAFLIPYLVMFAFVGMPIFLLELALGQFTSCGPLNCWEFCPIVQGLGMSQITVSSMVSIYYNVIIAWSLFFLFSSLTNQLPWKNCDQPWNTKYCFDRMPDVACNASNLFRSENGTCTNGSNIIGIWNVHLFKNITGIRRFSASEEYYNHRVLRLSKGIEEMGRVWWDLCLCLLLAWIISFLCMLNGIKTTGKVVYFTALFPYVVLLILFGRGISLPGAYAGIYFYIKPDFNRILDAKVWNDAAIQMFFSMSNCWGGLIALASYNRFHNNILRDTLLVTSANLLTGLFAGFIIFSFLGFMSFTMKVNIEDVVESGPGLAFIVYPNAVSLMPIAPLWSVLFFLMLLTLGLDSQFATLETILTSLMDMLPWLRPRKTFTIFFICVIFFLLGLPLCTSGGAYMLQLMDSYCSGWGLLIIGIIECLSISWIYGCARFYKDVHLMLGFELSLWWRINWQFITPALILFILLFSWIDYTPARYGEYIFPKWADAIGWMMTLFCLIWIPAVAIYKICKEYNSSLKMRIYYLSLPSKFWGPALVQHRQLVTYVEGFDPDPHGLHNEITEDENSRNCEDLVINFQNSRHSCVTIESTV